VDTDIVLEKTSKFCLDMSQEPHQASFPTTHPPNTKAQHKKAAKNKRWTCRESNPGPFPVINMLREYYTVDG
jgi:hypothetical protein